LIARPIATTSTTTHSGRDRNADHDPVDQVPFGLACPFE
jgi:hypothetical protein